MLIYVIALLCKPGGMGILDYCGTGSNHCVHVRQPCFRVQTRPSVGSYFDEAEARVFRMEAFIVVVQQSANRSI